MYNLKNRTSLTAIATILMITIVASSIAILPLVNGQTVPNTITPSYVFIGASPTVVGVGQEAIIVAWTADMPLDVGEQSGKISSLNGRAAWNNPMVVNIVKPDGTNDTLSLPRTDPVGATWAIYVPNATGSYLMQVYFPGEWKNTTDSAGTTVVASRYYTPDWSAASNFTVTAEPAPTWNEAPISEDYWTRPINTADHLWYTLAGSWLAAPGTNYPQGTAGFTSNFVQGQGTETAHILWTRQYYAGGYGDETYGSTGLQTTHYQGINWNGIVLNGQLHYTPRITAHGIQGWEIVDLYTGDELSLDYNATRPAFGQIYNYESPNQHGAFTYLWRTSGVVLPPTVNIANAVQFVNGSVVQIAASQTVSSSTVSAGALWEMLDGYTGKTICYIANTTQTEFRAGGPVDNQGRPTGVSTGAAGTAVYGLDGSILRYNVVNLGSVANPQYYLQVWNTSAGTMVASQLGTGLWQWRPAAGHFGAGTGAYFSSSTAQYNNVHDGRDFFSTNTTVPTILGAPNAIANQTASISVIKEGEYMILTAAGFNNGTHTVPGFVIKLSLAPGQIGTLISREEFTPPSSNGGAEAVTLTGVYPEEGMILFHKTKTLERFGYSIDSGQQVWKSEPEVQFQYYGMSSNYYNGTLLSYGYGGVITCYDIKTGNVNWVYSADSIGTESAYGGTYPIGVAVIGDGKLYTVTGEHSPTQPLMRGPNLRCIDATTGKDVWKILGFFGGMSPTSSNILMSDGILVGLNYFDMQLYAFGRGPSAVTAETQNDVSVLGHKAVVKGTVTDQSPSGERDTNNVMDSALKGSPAISDEDMQAWMEYKYMEQVKPEATGVPVSVDAIDPNGNFVHLGDATSDMNGNYACAFTPEISGDFQIVVSFKGSNAYGPSSASTFLTVEDAPGATATPAGPTDSIADMYFVPAIAILAVLIIIVGAVLGLLLLRKRP